MPVYLSFSSMMLARPLGSIRGRASSSPRICGQLVQGQLDLEDVVPGRVAGRGRSPSPLARAADRGADVARPLPDAAASPWSRSGTRGCRSAAAGSRPARPRSCRSSRRGVMYFRRLVLILPRTICLNRLASRSIFRTTAVVPSPLGDSASPSLVGPHRPRRTVPSQAPGPQGAAWRPGGPSLGPAPFEMAKIRSGLANGKKPTGGCEARVSSARPARFHCDKTRLFSPQIPCRSQIEPQDLKERPLRPGSPPPPPHDCPRARRPQPVVWAQWLPRLTSPRAKMLATKFSTSVAESSS